MQAAAVVDLTVVLLPLSGLHGDDATHADHTHHYMDHTHHMSQAYKLTSGRQTDHANHRYPPSHALYQNALSWSMLPSGMNIIGGGGREPPPPPPPDDEMTITKCRPTKVQCSHSPGSLLFETQDEALDVGHCCNQKKTM